MAILRRAPPPLPAQLARMAAHCSGDLAGLRDRALLLLAAVGLDGEQLRGLDREHVRLTDTGGAELLVLDGAGLQAPRRVLTLKRGPGARLLGEGDLRCRSLDPDRRISPAP